MTNAMDKTEARDLKAELKELYEARRDLAKENESLKAQLAKAQAQAADARSLQGIVDLSDEAFRLLNANALEIPKGADLMAPSGMEPEIRPHTNFMMALERVLDGFDRALNGFTSSKGRKFPGTLDNAKYWKGKLAELAANGDALMITNGDGSGARPTRDAFVPYTRWVETEELIALLTAVQGRFVEAYEMVSNGETYKPFEERMEERREEAAKSAEKMEKSAAKVADMLQKAPSLSEMLARARPRG